MKTIDVYREAHAATTVGEELRLIRAAAPRFRELFQASGKPSFEKFYRDKSQVPRT